MKNNLKFYRCEVCGNMFGLIKDAGPHIDCCGQAMVLLEANTSDASQEKHVPVVEKVDGKLHVTVGSVNHPMEAEHYIEWIVVATDNSTHRFLLEPGNEPQVTVCDVTSGTGSAYAYCNLHGLWKTSF